MSGLLLNLSVNADDPQIHMLVDTCIACHGTDGSSVGSATPNIANMRETLFIKAMRDMRSGERPSTVMRVIAKGYTDGETRIMAKFFSQQQAIPHKQDFDVQKAQKGRKLHNLYCNGCHKIEGPTKLLSNNLAGQQMFYLRHRLNEFVSDTDPTISPLMKNALKHFIDNNSQASLDYLIHYYASLGGK
jgi:sulfide dehydrogenase cytochrome subunit